MEASQPDPPLCTREHGPQGNPRGLQSIGGMIRTMLLTAHDLGLGSQWIADVLHVYTPIREWIDRREELVAAASLWASKSW